MPSRELCFRPSLEYCDQLLISMQIIFFYQLQHLERGFGLGICLEERCGYQLGYTVIKSNWKQNRV